MSVPKLDQYETPGGKKQSLFNLGDWWGMILGAGVLIVVWRVANAGLNTLSRYVPFGGLLGGGAPAASVKPASTAPSNTAPFAHVQ